MADNRWFLAVQGNRIGPLPDDQLPELVKEGKLEPETLVWRKGMGAWKPAREVEEIQSLLGAGSPATASPTATAPAPADAPGGTAWFVAEGGTKLGPLPPEKVEALAREGRLDGETFVWRKGQGEWKPAKNVPEMAPFLAARPATPAEPAAAPAEKPEPEPAPASPPEAEADKPSLPPERWYIARDGDRIGPFSTSDFPGLVADGRLTPDSLVWRKGLGAWKAAREIPEMESALAAPPPASDTAWEAESDGPEVAADAEAPEEKAVSDPAVEDILRRMTGATAGSPAPGAAEEPATEPAPAAEESAAESALAAEEPAGEPAAEPAAESAPEPATVDGGTGEGEAEPEPVDDTAETTVDLAADAGTPAGDAPAEAASPAEESSGPVPVEQVLAQKEAAEAASPEPEGEWAAVSPESAAAAPKKPLAPAAGGAKAPDKPRKKASILLLVLLAIATDILCVPLLYGAYVHVVKGSQPTPFTPSLPPWGAELATWGIFVFLPFLGLLSALFSPYRIRWAHAGQFWFWLLSGAGLGTAWGTSLEALAAAMQALFKQAQSDFARLPDLASAMQWCEQQSVTRADVNFPMIVAGAAVAVAVVGVLYLLWRFPWAKWAPMAKPPATSYKKGAPPPPPAEPPPPERFSWARVLCRLVFLAWVFLLLPFWLINQLSVGLRWSESLVVPLGRTLGMQLPATQLGTFLPVLPVLAVIGMGMVLPRWRPYRGAVKTARLLGLLSLVLFVLSAGLLPANHLMRRRPKPPAPPAQAAPADPSPDGDAPGQSPETGTAPAALPPAQVEAMKAADNKLTQATAQLQELQAGVKAGTTGLKPKADRVDALLGEAIASYESVQEACDKAQTKIPVELLHALKRATEARKVLRSVRSEMK